MFRATICAQRLDVAILLLGQIVAGKIEGEGAAEGDVDRLHPFADAEQRKLTFHGRRDSFEFPCVAAGVEFLAQN